MGSLFFARGNAKLGSHVYNFSLPAGHTCPSARECLSKTDPETGRLRDGPHTQFRCFAASQEVKPSVRVARWRNFNLIREAKTAPRISSLILDSLPANAEFVRVHVSGDFFSATYLDAWLRVAVARPRTVFYWYTKQLLLWINRLDEIGSGFAPGKIGNVVPTASYGGRYDTFIKSHGLRYATVVFDPADTSLEIDHDDSHAQRHGESFALLLHGVQPANTPASAALKKLKASGFTGYSRRKPLEVVS